MQSQISRIRPRIGAKVRLSICPDVTSCCPLLSHFKHTSFSHRLSLAIVCKHDLIHKTGSTWHISTAHTDGKPFAPCQSPICMRNVLTWQCWEQPRNSANKTSTSIGGFNGGMVPRTWPQLIPGEATRRLYRMQENLLAAGSPPQRSPDHLAGGKGLAAPPQKHCSRPCGPRASAIWASLLTQNMRLVPSQHDMTGWIYVHSVVPVMWNSLLKHMRSPTTSKGQFRRGSKTNLLQQAYVFWLPRVRERILLNWTELDRWYHFSSKL